VELFVDRVCEREDRCLVEWRVDGARRSVGFSNRAALAEASSSVRAIRTARELDPCSTVEQLPELDQLLDGVSHIAHAAS
jgi:hypothetical protein